MIDIFRDQTERVSHRGFEFQIMPKAHLLRRYAITMMLWPPMAGVELKLIPQQLFERSPGLQGGMKITRCKFFKKTDLDNQGRSMEGARLIQLAGNQDFLQSLYQFPRSHRFGLGPGSVIIRGGERRAESDGGRERRTGRQNDAGRHGRPSKSAPPPPTSAGRGRGGPARNQPELSQQAAIYLLNQSKDQILREAIDRDAGTGSGRGRGSGRGNPGGGAPPPPGQRSGKDGAKGAGAGP